MRKAILLASVLALLGCSNGDFNRPELLNRPRILAIQAEPPQPTLGASTTLRALVYLPPAPAAAGSCATGSASATYRWSWCPLPTTSSNGYVCPIDQNGMDQLFSALGLGPAPLLDLGTGETATFVNPFPAQLLFGLCRGDVSLLPASTDAGAAVGGSGARQSSAFTCDLSAGDDTSHPESSRPVGFPITISLTVTPPCATTTLPAVFTMHLPTDDSIPGNQNPVPRGISVASHWSDAAVPAADAGAGPVDSAIGGGEDALLAEDGGAALGEAGNPGIDGGGASEAGAPVTEDAAPAAPDTASPPEDASAWQDTTPGFRLDDTGSVSIQRQQHVGLTLAMPIESSEFLPRPGTLDVLDKEGTQIIHFERLNFSWFAEAGDFGSDGQGGHRTGYLPNPPAAGDDPTVRLPADSDGFERAISNTWNLPKVEDYANSTARITVVVRDGRGGVAWTTGVASLEDRP